jgi:3-methyl-2-oxobutanoate hydroxymethyltransferase
MLGLFNDFVPKHTKRYADLRAEIGKALSEYAKEVRDSKFPSEEQSF